MRGKEEAHDYRYFPDPDLPPVVVDEARIEELRSAMPELPTAKRARWQKELGPHRVRCGVLSGHPEIAHYFEEAARPRRAERQKAAKAGKKVGNFVQAEVLRHVTTDGLHASFPVAASSVAELLSCVEDGTINGKIAKKVFADHGRHRQGAEAHHRREGPRAGHRHRRHRGRGPRASSRRTRRRWSSTRAARRTSSATSSAR